MSQLSARSAAFLHEMGIGVQWQLRHAAQGQDGAGAGADTHPPEAVPARPLSSSQSTAPAQAVEPARQMASASQPLAASHPAQAADVQRIASLEHAADVQRIALPEHAADAQRIVSPEHAADAQPVASPSQFAAVPPASAAPQAVAPPPVAVPQPPRAQAVAQRDAAAPPHRVDAAPPAATIDDESTAWFDDAPMPPPAAAPARTAPVSDEAIAQMDWDALQAAVATCTRCPLCATRRAAIPGRGAENARWVAIAAAPTQADEQAGAAISGDAGLLLNNMLKAIELRPEQDVYVATLVKCRPVTADGADRAASAEEVLACRPFLDRELALTGATMAMTFGQFAARGLMMGTAARGKVMRYGASELPVVATYHPDDLLRKPEDKAKAWADLCLARSSHG